MTVIAVSIISPMKSRQWSSFCIFLIPFLLFYLCSVRFAFSPLSEEEEEDEQKEPMLKESFGTDKIHLLFVLYIFFSGF